MTDIAMTLSVAEEAIALLTGNNRACSDGGSREDKCGSGEGSRVRTENGSFSETRPLYNRGRPRKKLLCLQGIWAHSLSL